MPEQSFNAEFGWLLLAVGLVTVLAGLWFFIGPSIPWPGRLPGDIRIEGDNYGFYLPIATCLLISVVLSLILWAVSCFVR